MKFIDYKRNTQIELIDMGTCKLFINESVHLEGVNRLLNAYVRRAALDGGNPVNFVHELKAQEGYILIKGDIFEIIQSICDIDRISEELRNQIMEMIIINGIRKVRFTIPHPEQLGFIARLRPYLDMSLEQLRSLPSPFSIESK